MREEVKGLEERLKDATLSKAQRRRLSRKIGIMKYREGEHDAEHASFEGARGMYVGSFSMAIKSYESAARYFIRAKKPKRVLDCYRSAIAIAEQIPVSNNTYNQLGAYMGKKNLLERINRKALRIARVANLRFNPAEIPFDERLEEMEESFHYGEKISDKFSRKEKPFEESLRELLERLNENYDPSIKIHLWGTTPDELGIKLTLYSSVFLNRSNLPKEGDSRRVEYAKISSGSDNGVFSFVRVPVRIVEFETYIPKEKLREIFG
ncbi:MAG: hypothetical protein WC548_03700 [Candidatus Pacearchaeota archaeon]